MDIKIPKVVSAVDLGGYTPELAGKYLHVWVNPPLAMLREHDEIVSPPAPPDAGLDEDMRIFEWFARILSQAEDKSTHWTAVELAEARKADPAFYLWIIRVVWDERGRHIAKKKPN